MDQIAASFEPMKTRTTWLVFAISALCRLGASPAAADAPAGKPTRTRIALAQVLPPLDGNHLNARITEVMYGPGGRSPPHSHPCPVMVYVVEGAIRTQVKGEPEAVYHAGQTFFEAANGIHQVSANARADASARFVAISICDREVPLSVPPVAADRSK
jgi:quercetin dioxygenase-like cupin family protein